jgi:hypothetical protein
MQRSLIDPLPLTSLTVIILAYPADNSHFSMIKPTNSSSTALFPKDRELSWRDRHQIRRGLGKADKDTICGPRRFAMAT